VFILSDPVQKELKLMSSLNLKKRAVITGIGIISPNGTGKEKFWRATLAGKSGVRHITSFDASCFPSRVAGIVEDFDPAQYMDAKSVKRTSRSVHFAVAATKMAIEDAGLNKTEVQSPETHIIFGSGPALWDVVAPAIERYHEGGWRNMRNLNLLNQLSHFPTSFTVKTLGITGQSLTIKTMCTAAINCLGIASSRIVNGEAKIVLTGSAEATVNELAFANFSTIDALTKSNDRPEKASRPFDAMRDGGVLSEGAAVLVLEEAEAALLRGAEILGEIVGYSSVSEFNLNGGENLRQSECEKHFLAIKRAIENAEIDPAQIDYISSCAPSDKELDVAETDAIKRLFGKRAYRIPINSIRSMIGNVPAAGGAIQVAAALLTIRDGIIPPTINYEIPDPECDLDYVPNCARRANVKTVLVNTHGIGGNASSLIVRKFPSR